ncbi:aminodeoxychorismate synthase component I [Thalassotalea euphylliae]|uniref:aminodeoxychorismate synthase n=1 Tax=Thalassotalea euphylliae TaxID=1655234 RepID=A0A3E0UGX0_9GAMM|nr:aminodeoxychorismate synthase component I [Thalassotalea euphylliae]
MPALDKSFELVARPINVSEPQAVVSLFSHYANQPWSFWLDSNESDHQDSRFDIIVTNPVLTIETRAQRKEHSNDNLTHAVSTNVVAHSIEYQTLAGEFSGDPLARLKQLERSVFEKVTLPKTHLPFKTGAIGYFSYDLGRCFERLPAIADDDINLPLMAVGIYTQALVFDRQQSQLYLIAPSEKWQQYADEVMTLVAATIDNSDKTDKNEQQSFSLTSDWQTNMSKAQYQQKFAQVQAYLHSGDCYQINLAQRFQANYQGDEFSAYLKLREANQAPFSAFMRLPSHSIVSISPERFVQLSGNKVQTKPIKGTLTRGETAEADKANAEQLSNSTKDRAENLMIVDLLRNDLSRVCQAGSVKVPKLFDIESFPAVHHLVSTVEGELASEHDGSDLLRAAFPGGSITGAPKIRAMEIIEELEPHRRNLYCGSIGYLSACGNMDTSITIRTLICQNQQIYCWAGGGLVADSKVDSEYQETFDKVRKILPVLAN